ncbi:hypothetical protein [Empedobacter sp. GD03797]|uniref:hypothetical protein n=1 Tax=Empedobacter sp. GD03797 TaxID=2975382 RepID=UPI002447D5D4|nr:hypothetical protein [Empedobacter sp. GD03797]MDH1880948.1 hypothetical protein [Empedobacter sp. GD03797]
MKKIYLFLFFLSSMFVFSQEFRLNQDSKNKLGKIDKELLNKVLFIEHFLNEKNDPYFSVLYNYLNTANLTSKQLEKFNTLVCVECYKREWDAILLDNKNKSLAEKRIFDSIRNEKNELRRIEELNRIEFQRVSEENNKRIQDSIRSTPLFSNPYDAIYASVNKMKRNTEYLTVFRGMDYNFAGGNFQNYMQRRFGYGISKDYTLTSTKIIENYISKVSSTDQKLKVVYNVSERKDIVGYYPADKVYLIKDVMITGTNNEVVNLFIKYWPSEIKVGSYKEGIIATKQLLGDNIQLEGYKGNYRIYITKGNMDVNYETSWGINKLK